MRRKKPHTGDAGNDPELVGKYVVDEDQGIHDESSEAVDENSGVFSDEDLINEGVINDE